MIKIYLGRGHARHEVGIASIDVKSPNITLSQYSDSSTFVRTMTKLNILNPVEIIFPNTLTEAASQSELYRIISESSSCTITSVQRRYFNESTGLQYLKQLSISSFDDIKIADKYYCLAAIGALLKYIEFIQNTIFAPHSIPIRFTGAEKSTNIDATTARLLELVCNNLDIRSSQTLYGILNRTKTPGGAKLLRSTILQPSCDSDTINLRYDCIEEILNNEELFNSLESVLGRFVDVDTTISLLISVPKQETVQTAENRISHIIFLKHLLELVEPLKTAIKGGQNSLFKAFSDSLNDKRFNIIKEKISEIIHEDTYYQKGALNMRTQKCFAVKPYLNGLLDVARRTYSELVDDITETVKSLAQKYNLPLKTGFTSTRGFFIQIPGTNVSELPCTFVKVVQQQNSITCTTGDIIKLNDRITESLTDIYVMTNEVTKVLLQEIYPYIGCMYKLSECSATLDMITSFANVCMMSNYVRPEFTDTLALKSSLHPILAKIETHETIPNDVFASSQSNFMIITGPNMSGKSTYLRQIALLHVMAQVGCFVPAEYASLRIIDNIFSRVGSDDDIETNASTFTMEMREMKYILDNVTDRSLVIIDELGRGTSVDEGSALCFAICEDMIQRSEATVFIATHFKDIQNLEYMYPNAVNYYFDVNYECMSGSEIDKIEFCRKLKRGMMPYHNYGIKLSKYSSLPQSIIANAEKLSKELQEDSTLPRHSVIDEKKIAIFNLAAYITQLVNNSELPIADLQNKLLKLKQKVLPTWDESFSSDTALSAINDPSAESAVGANTRTNSSSTTPFLSDVTRTFIGSEIGKTLSRGRSHDTSRSFTESDDKDCDGDQSLNRSNYSSQLSRGRVSAFTVNKNFTTSMFLPKEQSFDTSSDNLTN